VRLAVPAKQIHGASDKALSSQAFIRRTVTQLRRPKIDYTTAAVRPRDVWVLGIEGVHIEVLHTVDAVKVVQRGTLAQRNQEYPVSIDGKMRVSREEALSVFLRYSPETLQVVGGQWRLRPFCCCAN
jgi:hypothetical protein